MDKPKCPSVRRLREIINNNEGAVDELKEEVVEALDWLATFLEDRALYHKKQQIKKKIVFAKMAELGITDEINSLTETAVFDEVANSEPEIERLRR